MPTTSRDRVRKMRANQTEEQYEERKKRDREHKRLKRQQLRELRDGTTSSKDSSLQPPVMSPPHPIPFPATEQHDLPLQPPVPSLPQAPVIRRSARDKVTETAKTEQLCQKIRHPNYSGLEVKASQEKGRGVFATKGFEKGDFLVEYSGELVSRGEGLHREQRAEEDGGYLFFFSHDGQCFCIDATNEDGTLGRLINHSRLAGNCTPKKIVVDGQPHIYFVAANAISPGEELMFDYGERRTKILKDFPFLKY